MGTSFGYFDYSRLLRSMNDEYADEKNFGIAIVNHKKRLRGGWKRK